MHQVEAYFYNNGEIYGLEDGRVSVDLVEKYCERSCRDPQIVFVSIASVTETVQSNEQKTQAGNVSAASDLRTHAIPLHPLLVRTTVSIKLRFRKR